MVKMILRAYRVYTCDPYEYAPHSYTTTYLWERPFSGQSEQGFGFKYVISCYVVKFDWDQFRAHRMIEEKSQQDLLEAWHRDVFLPKLKQLSASFRFQRGFDNPFLCRKVGKDVYGDFNFSDAGNQIVEIEYRRNGCKVVFSTLHFEWDTTLMEENNRMLTLIGTNAARETEEYRKWEESFVVAALNRRLELERDLQLRFANQEHKGSNISVKTRTIGRSVELAWKITQGDGCTLRGYRSADGFAPNDSDFASNGMCFAEASSDGKSAQVLEMGKEYFYTFTLTTEVNVYAKETLGDLARSLIGFPAVKGTRTRLVDSVRFVVNVPSQAELLEVERMLERAKTPPTDPKREKINRAIEELSLI